MTQGTAFLLSLSWSQQLAWNVPQLQAFYPIKLDITCSGKTVKTYSVQSVYICPSVCDIYTQWATCIVPFTHKLISSEHNAGHRIANPDIEQFCFRLLFTFVQFSFLPPLADFPSGILQCFSSGSNRFPWHSLKKVSWTLFFFCCVLTRFIEVERLLSPRLVCMEI
jgi:hypothetical protein